MADPFSFLASAITVASLVPKVVSAVDSLQKDQKIAERLAIETREVVEQLTLVYQLIEARYKEVNSNPQIPQDAKDTWNKSAKKPLKSFPKRLRELEILVRDPQRNRPWPQWRQKLEKAVKESVDHIHLQLSALNVVVTLTPRETSQGSQGETLRLGKTKTSEDEISSLLSTSKEYTSQEVEKIVNEYIKAKEEQEAMSKATKDLIHAIHTQDNEIAERLLRDGANVTEYDQHGWTAMHHCAHCNNVHITKIVLEVYPGYKEELLNLSTNFKDDSLLHVAVPTNKTEFGRFALENGANLYAVNGAGLTPFGFAVKNNKWDFEDMLKEVDKDVEEKSKQAEDAAAD